MSVEQAGHFLGLSRNGAYAAAARGDIPTIRIGRKLLVPKHRLLAILEGCGSSDLMPAASDRIRRVGGDWQFREGDDWRTFRSPDGPASRWQLVVLHREGLLRLANKPGAPISVFEAAAAIDHARRDEVA
jgi:hypothetical protein